MLSERTIDEKENNKDRKNNDLPLRGQGKPSVVEGSIKEEQGPLLKSSQSAFDGSTNVKDDNFLKKVVRLENLGAVLSKLNTATALALDTETTGLRPHQGSQLFAIIIADGETEYYFNFNAIAEDCPEETLIPRKRIDEFQTLFRNPKITWFMHNANFDCAILANDNLCIHGRVCDTKVGARILRNDHLSYSLDACAKRIGFEKSKIVDEYISKYKLYTKIDGETQKHFDRVPFHIIVPYALRDARITYALGVHQLSDIGQVTAATRKIGSSLPTLQQVYDTEVRLTKTVANMERSGVRIDKEYVLRASQFETARANEASRRFEEITGKHFKTSGKLFSEIFLEEKNKWEYTEKGNPSFSSDVIEKFQHPAAKAVIEYRDAKAKSDFYNGFLYFADSSGRLHASFDQAGTDTGRFSSNNPNMQNCFKEEGDSEWKVRRSFIPEPGYTFFELDYSAMEFRLMVDYAGIKRLADRIMNGEDPHQSTADLVGISRKDAKTLNFALTYGAGADKVAKMLGKSSSEARDLKNKYFSRLSEVKNFLHTVTNTAKARGYIFNKFGRRSYFSNPEFAYRAPNHLIQGTGADIVKKAMNLIDDRLDGMRSKMVLQVHDSILFEIHNQEFFIVEEIKKIMEDVYPYNVLPMGCSVEYSDKSWGDLKKYDGAKV